MVTKHLRWLLLLVGLAGLTLVGITSAPDSHATDSTNLYIAPSSQNVTAGANVSFTITIDPGGASVNTAQSVMSWAPGNFSLISVTPGPAFNSFPNTATTSSLSFSAASISPITTSQTVATIVLHAVAAGTAPVSLASVCAQNDFSLNCSAAYDSATSDNDLTSASGASFTIVPPPPAGSGSAGTTSSPAPGKSSGASARPSTPTISSSSSAPTPTDSANPVPSSFVPTAASSASAAKTVTITVVDSKHKPVSHAKVALGQTNQYTDSSGRAAFQNLPAGRQMAVITIRGHSSNHAITIAKGSGDTRITIKLAAGRGIIPYAESLGLVLLVLLIIVVISRQLGRWQFFADDDEAAGIVVGSGFRSGPKPVADGPSLTSMTIDKLEQFVATHPRPIKPGSTVTPRKHD